MDPFAKIVNGRKSLTVFPNCSVVDVWEGSKCTAVVPPKKSNLKMLENFRSSSPEVLLGKDVLKIYSKFTGEHPCQSVISIKQLCNFIEITLWNGCYPVNSLHRFRTALYKNTYGGLLPEFSAILESFTA